LLYHANERDGVLDKKGILSEFEENRGRIVKMNFETVAQKFKLIESNTHSIVIPSDEIKFLIEQIRKDSYTRETLRKLQRFSVSVYEQEYKKLCNADAIKTKNGVNLLVAPNYYSQEKGLDIFTDDNKNA
jgi:CRISPR-associated endonuclease/helicase Cas3